MVMHNCVLESTMSISKAFKNYPMMSQCAASAFLFGLGDVITQKIYEPRTSKVKDNRFDYTRTAQMSIFGAVVAAPAVFYWYRYLERRIILKKPLTTLLARVLADQLVFAPCFIGVFFLGTNYMRTLDVKKSIKNTKENYWSALKMNYVIWPAVQMFNFFFVPLNYRLIFVNSVAIGWNGYLSWTNNRK